MKISSPFERLVRASRNAQKRSPFRPIKPMKKLNRKRVYKPKTLGNPRISFPASMQNMMKGLSSALSRITRKTPTEDYDAVIRGFLPTNAKVLAPQFPRDSGRYVFADLDGDSQKELVTTYRLNDLNVTMALKKQGGQWMKVAEYAAVSEDSLNFTGAANITGGGREQLLLGWKTKENRGELQAYSLHNGQLNQLFKHAYNHMEVLPSSNRQASNPSQLALWNLNARGVYDVALKEWNGSEIVDAKNQTTYYHSHVLPYYGRMVKKMPQNPSNWYGMAVALEKAGMDRDALTAVEMASRYNPTASNLQELSALKERLVEKLKT
ncbi:MAG: hypothetical protein N2484_12320 [Clostridia bacterium]|nr:hypothetical protein [Clostridia bacterium]